MPLTFSDEKRREGGRGVSPCHLSSDSSPSNALLAGLLQEVWFLFNFKDHYNICMRVSRRGDKAIRHENNQCHRLFFKKLKVLNVEEMNDVRNFNVGGGGGGVAHSLYSK